MTSLCFIPQWCDKLFCQIMYCVLLNCVYWPSQWCHQCCNIRFTLPLLTCIPIETNGKTLVLVMYGDVTWNQVLIYYCVFHTLPIYTTKYIFIHSYGAFLAAIRRRPEPARMAASILYKQRVNLYSQLRIWKILSTFHPQWAQECFWYWFTKMDKKKQCAIHSGALWW